MTSFIVADWWCWYYCAGCWKGIRIISPKHTKLDTRLNLILLFLNLIMFKVNPIKTSLLMLNESILWLNSCLYYSFEPRIVVVLTFYLAMNKILIWAIICSSRFWDQYYLHEINQYTWWFGFNYQDIKSNLQSFVSHICFYSLGF